MASQKKNNEAFPWALIVILFVLGLWPIALVILFIKLFGSDNKKSQQKAPPLAGESAQKKQQKAPPKKKRVTKSPIPKQSTAKRLKIIGTILIFVGLAACWDPIDMMIFVGGIKSYYVEEMLQALAVAVGGGAMLGSGITMANRLKRYTKYLAVMGDRDAIATEELARTLDIPQKQVEKDIQKMLDNGYFGGKAYLNMELGYLLRSSEADIPLKKEQEAQAPQATEEGYSGILREIRRANDEIADPVLSAKIDRLEEIAARIFKIVEEDPTKAERISSFFNYYLPTTQKLLDSYAKFESAGVQGENLTQAKARIESTMDTIVNGFEYQLDVLYKNDAMDVDRDIRVMEIMMNRDTVSAEKDFGLGTASAQKEKTE